MRKYAQLNIAIWNDDDFRALTPQAQHLYFLLLSHPTLSYCGVGDWRPARIARMATGWEAEDVEHAGVELVDRLFIVVDEDTEEFLVRTFIKNDPLMRQRNLGVSMARAYSTVASDGIRGVIVHELQRLESDSPELKSFGADEVRTVLEKPAIDPSVYPCGKGSVEGSIEGSINPYGKGSVKGSINPKISEFNPSVKGSTKGSTEGSIQGSPTPAPSPSTVTTGEFSGERLEGVKGGPGGKGKPTTANAEHPKTESTPNPFYESLDALADAHAQNPDEAYGTIDDPRCAKHKDLDRAPACWDCKAAGDTLKAQADQQRAQRRAAIDACNQCDDNGWVIGTNPAVKCDHQPHLKAIGGPY